MAKPLGIGIAVQSVEKENYLMYEVSTGDIVGSFSGDTVSRDKKLQWLQALFGTGYDVLKVDNAVHEYADLAVKSGKIVPKNVARVSTEELGMAQIMAHNDVYMAVRAEIGRHLGPIPHASQLETIRDDAIAAIDAAIDRAAVDAALAQFHTDWTAQVNAP